MKHGAEGRTYNVSDREGVMTGGIRFKQWLFRCTNASSKATQGGKHARLEGGLTGVECKDGIKLRYDNSALRSQSNSAQYERKEKERIIGFLRLLCISLSSTCLFRR
jgi:hypothetical protein